MFGNLEKFCLLLYFGAKSGCVAFYSYGKGLLECPGDPSYGQEFGYDGNSGPDFWGVKYQGCNGGKLQSPIDIELNNITEKSFPPLIFEHFNEELRTVKLVNNGHTVLLAIKEGITPSVRGGPLNGTYNFAQLHFHWGRTDEEGSENLINNQSFPLELHMVLFNTGYGTFQKALEHDDGLTVLSFLYHKTIKRNRHYEKFEDELPAVENLNATVEIIDFISLDNFTTTDRDEYFTYKGSLTTPPCSEVVTWIEFMNTIPLSHEQIQVFRLLSGSQGKLNHNFRPTQARNDRAVYKTPFNDDSSNDLSNSNTPKIQKSSSTRLTASSIVITCFALLLFRYFSFTVN